MEDWVTEWTVVAGNIEVMRTEDAAEAVACFEEYCGFDEAETVTLLKNGQLDDQRDGFTADEDESEDESEDEDCE
jgi:hypothetical protein